LEDAVELFDRRSCVSVAAAAMAVSAGGGATARTVVLLTDAQIDAAAEKQTTYRPPGNQCIGLCNHLVAAALTGI
jgi:hypothetical protein